MKEVDEMGALVIRSGSLLDPLDIIKSYPGQTLS